MPFVETYSVNFANGNRQPHVNLRGWPDMSQSVATPEDLAQQLDDASGLILKLTRSPGAAGSKPSRNYVYVMPPPGHLQLDTRLLMRVEFDLPNADMPADDGAKPIWRPPAEPWGVALNVSLTNDLAGDHMVNVTCQFNAKFNGVRLNTSASLQGIGALQTDDAACLETPLNYSSYQGGYTVLPDGAEGEAKPPMFTLEHAFSGWNAAANQHTVGSGALKIVRSWQPSSTVYSTLNDQRVYSSNALNALLSPVTSVANNTIDALGVSLVTLKRIGWISVRLHSFSLWINDSIEVDLIE